MMMMMKCPPKETAVQLDSDKALDSMVKAPRLPESLRYWEKIEGTGNLSDIEVRLYAYLVLCITMLFRPIHSVPLQHFMHKLAMSTSIYHHLKCMVWTARQWN